MTQKKTLLALILLMMLALGLMASAAAEETAHYVGEEITFGCCPQNADGKDSTPVQWTVLEVYEDGSLLAISNKILFYHTWSDRFSNAMGNSGVKRTSTADSQGTDSITDPGFSPENRASYEEWAAQNHYVDTIEFSRTEEDLARYADCIFFVPTMDDVDKYNLGKCLMTEYARESGVYFDSGKGMYWLNFGKDYFDETTTVGKYHIAHWHDVGPIMDLSGNAVYWNPGSLGGHGSSAEIGYRPMVYLIPSHLDMTLSLWSDGDEENNTVSGEEIARSVNGKNDEGVSGKLDYCDGNLLMEDPLEDDVFFLRVETAGFNGEKEITLNLPEAFTFNRDRALAEDRKKEKITMRGDGSEGSVKILPVYSVYCKRSESSFNVSINGASEDKTFTLNIPCNAKETNVLVNEKIIEKSVVNWSGLFGAEVPTQYDHSLANLSCFLSFSALDEGRTSESLHNLGFHSFEWMHTGHNEYGSECCMAIKTLTGSNGTVNRLVAIIIRGTDGPREWLGNLMVGDRENPTTFKTSSHTIYMELKRYLFDRKLSKENVSIYSCGHSRGGAVCNLLVHNLLSLGFNGVGYTFAPPNCVLESEVSYQDNIYNFKYAQDVVSFVPQNYINHGHTYVIGLGRSSERSNAFQEKYLALTSKKWVVPGTTSLIQNIIALGKGGNWVATNHPYIAIATIFTMANFNTSDVVRAHMQDAYVPWVTTVGNTQAKNYTDAIEYFERRQNPIGKVLKKGSEISVSTAERIESAFWKLSVKRKNMKLLAVSCPVDVTLCTPDGQVAAWTKDHEVQTYNDNIAFAISEGDTDFFVFPADAGYTLEINGTGKGTMTIAACDVDDSMQAETVSVVADVPVTNTDTFTLNPNASGGKDLTLKSDSGKNYSASDGKRQMLPGKLKALPDGAFSGDKSLHGIIECPEGIVSIGSKVFADTKISKVLLPKSVQEIAEDAFKGMSKKVTFECYSGSYAEEWLKQRGYSYSLRGK